MSVVPKSRMSRGILAELVLLTLCGFIVGELGPFGTNAFPFLKRHIYWLLCIVGGGLIGIGIDAALRRPVLNTWQRLALTVIAMTPVVTAYVLAVDFELFGAPRNLASTVILLWQVLVISLAVMTTRALVWRETKRVIETRTVFAPPMPEVEAAFRRRLSAKRRVARLIAVEAHDHYLRVYTDSGEEMVTARFADALDELGRAHGFRIHRSWWVSAEAIEAVQWRRGSGEARLFGGLRAPVSRTYAHQLKGAGWF